MVRKVLFAFTFAFFLLAFSEIQAQSLLKGAKIPEDLVIKYWSGSGIGSSEFTIKSDGRVFYKSYSNLPANPNNAKLLGLLDKNAKNKKSKLRNKLSAKQLKELVYDFEKIEFLSFPTNRQLNYLDGCTNTSITSSSTTTALTFEINGKSATVSADIYCNGTNKSIAGKFESLAKKVGEILKTVEYVISE